MAQLNATDSQVATELRKIVSEVQQLADVLALRGFQVSIQVDGGKTPTGRKHIPSIRIVRYDTVRL